MRGDTGYAYLPAGQAEVEFAKYERRIKQLEQQCATLAEQVDRMRPVVDAARTIAGIGLGQWIDLHGKIEQYDAEMAVLTKGTTLSRDDIYK